MILDKGMNPLAGSPSYKSQAPNPGSRIPAEGGWATLRIHCQVGKNYRFRSKRYGITDSGKNGLFRTIILAVYTATIAVFRGKIWGSGADFRAICCKNGRILQYIVQRLQYVIFI